MNSLLKASHSIHKERGSKANMMKNILATRANFWLMKLVKPQIKLCFMISIDTT